MNSSPITKKYITKTKSCTFAAFYFLLLAFTEYHSQNTLTHIHNQLIEPLFSLTDWYAKPALISGHLTKICLCGAN